MVTSKKKKRSSSKWSAERREKFNAKKAIQQRLDNIAVDRVQNQPISDPVNHPKHYNTHPSGIECIDIVEHMGFNIGNAITYLWRAKEKGNEFEDYRKAIWYINREIQKRERELLKRPSHLSEKG